MNVPCDDFMRDLMDFKEGYDYKTMVRTEQREALSNTFFPYNKQLTRTILRDKHVMFIGDSLVRAMYKDMVSLIQTGELCSVQDLRISNEDSFLGDKHIDFLELEANRVFRQAREFQSNRHLIQYYFTNRAMREDLEKTCMMMEATQERPDVVIMNSAIWDVSRFPTRVDTGRRHQQNTHLDFLEDEISVAEEYYSRVAMFVRRMRVLLPPSSTVIWVLMPPSSTPETEGGFMSLNHLKFHEIRMRLLEANSRVAQIVRESGFDVLDFSFHFRLSNYQVFRVKDGVHFNIIATRYMNQLVLGHLAVAWQIDDIVGKRWPQKIVDRANEKGEYFQTALDFLQGRNDDRFINEEIQQALRRTAFENFRLPYRNGDSSVLTMEQLHQNLRVILMFMKFAECTKNTAQTHAKAFSEIPLELSRFSQEDIQKLGEMISECIKSWKGFMPGLRLSVNNKRPFETRGRLPLLPTPYPPGIQLYDNQYPSNGGGIREVAGTESSISSPISISSADSTGGTPSSGNPHRIADAEPLFPKKKPRYMSRK